MRRKIVSTLFIFIIGTQVFPVQGFQFWYNLLKFDNTIDAPMVQVIQEERFEESHFKLKQPSASTPHCLEFQALLTSTNNRIRVILSLGSVSDRSDPIIIPPPNQFV